MREPDLLWETWMQLAYSQPRPILTKSERGRINAALKQLREVNATPEQMKERWARLPKVLPPGAILTINGLVSNWSRCAPQKRKVSHPSHTEWQTPEWQK